MDITRDVKSPWKKRVKVPDAEVAGTGTNHLMGCSCLPGV